MGCHSNSLRTIGRVRLIMSVTGSTSVAARVHLMPAAAAVIGAPCLCASVGFLEKVLDIAVRLNP